MSFLIYSKNVNVVVLVNNYKTKSSIYYAEYENLLSFSP